MHLFCLLFPKAISIHAPTRGATDGRKIHRPTETYFNPRSHERSDVVSVQVVAVLLTISIHAPTRGATDFEVLKWKKLKISIHAPTRGATIDCGVIDNWRLFQSTLPREERRD